jgi:hypothetical protein
LPDHGEAHDRAPDVVLGVPVGEGRDDYASGARHTIAEQSHDVGRDLGDDGIEVGGGSKRLRRTDLVVGGQEKVSTPL